MLDWWHEADRQNRQRARGEDAPVAAARTRRARGRGGDRPGRPPGGAPDPLCQERPPCPRRRSRARIHRGRLRCDAAGRGDRRLRAVRILLDTQCWLWMSLAPERFSPRGRALVESTANTLYLSAASSWEIAIKYALGKLRLP